MNNPSDHDLLLRIDERMAESRRWQEEHMERCHLAHEAHDNKIRSLEEWKWKEAGGVSVVMLLLQLALRYLLP